MTRREYHYMVVVLVEDGKVIAGHTYVDGASTPSDNVFDLDTSEWGRPDDEAADTAAYEYLQDIINKGEGRGSPSKKRVRTP